MSLLQYSYESVSWLFNYLFAKDDFFIHYYIEGVTKQTTKIYVTKDSTMASIISGTLQKCHPNVRFNDFDAVCDDDKLFLTKPLCCNKIECGWTISFVYKHRKARGMRNCYENLENDCIVFDSTAFEVSKQIVMKSLRISCRSDKYIPATNYVGIILYAFKKEGIWTSDWVLNGKHCKTGYILIKQERNLHKIMQESAAGITRHMALFKWFFNELPNENTLGAGFSIQKKDSPKSGKKLDISKEIDGFEVDYDHYKLYVNSRSFNTANSAKNKNDLSSDVFHDNKKYMHQLEQKWIAIAVDRWKSGRIRCKEDGIIQINAENDCCDNCKRKILQTQF